MRGYGCRLGDYEGGCDRFGLRSDFATDFGSVVKSGGWYQTGMAFIDLRRGVGCVADSFLILYPSATFFST